MPHHRSRSSIDRTLDLLADLDDTQIELLLQEANSSTDTHIAVAQAVSFYERPISPITLQPRASMMPRSPTVAKKFLTSLSPKRKTSLRRKPSNRTSSAPEPRNSMSSPRVSLNLSRSSRVQTPTGARPMSPLSPEPRKSMSSPRNSLNLSRPNGNSVARPMSPLSPEPRKSMNSPRNSLNLSRPNRNSVARPMSPLSPHSMKFTSSKPPVTKTSRSYKRISRPFAMSSNSSAQGSPDIRELLAAYLLGTPSESSSASSPITPRSFQSASPMSFDRALWTPDPDDEWEDDDSPYEDLFEPSPSRTGTFRGAKPMPFDSMDGMAPIMPVRQPTRKISGIFELLAPNGMTSDAH